MVKWIKRGSPEKSSKCFFVASRKTALNDAQAGILGQKSLHFDKVFGINTIQFGTTTEAALKAKLKGAVNFGNLEKVMVDAGTPVEIAKARVAAIIDSLNINAGINEAVRAYGVKTAKLPDDFWGGDDDDAVTEAAETVEVALQVKPNALPACRVKPTGFRGVDELQ